MQVQIATTNECTFTEYMYSHVYQGRHKRYGWCGICHTTSFMEWQCHITFLIAAAAMPLANTFLTLK